MSSVIIGAAIGLVLGWLIQPFLKRRYYSVRSWWRFGRRRTDPSKSTTTTTTLDEMLQSNLIKPYLAEWHHEERKK